MFLCCQVGSFPALPLGTAPFFTHAVGMSVCIQSSSQEQAKYFSWRRNPWAPHREQPWTSTHRLAPGWGLTHAMEDWLRLNLPLIARAFVQGWSTTASLEMITIWHKSLQQVCWSDGFIIQSPAQKLWLLLCRYLLICFLGESLFQWLRMQSDKADESGWLYICVSGRPRGWNHAKLAAPSFERGRKRPGLQGMAFISEGFSNDFLTNWLDFGGETASGWRGLKLLEMNSFEVAQTLLKFGWQISF